MASNIPITNGKGQSSVAAEEIASLKYQQIKVVDGTAASTNAWIIDANGAGQVTTGNSSVIAIIAGSVISAPVANQSVSGTVGASVIGWVPIQPSNTSIITRWADSSVIGINAGSVVAISQGSVIAVFQSSSLIGVVTGSVVAIPTGNQSVSGTVGASVIGWVPIQASNTSIIGVLQANSIAGTYAEDTAHTQGDRGLFTLGVRNDTMASVTSADGDYSQRAVGPSGETLVANAPLTRWVRGTADLRVVLGASVTAIAAQGASVFTYITGVQVVNMGSASVIVTLAGGLGSILGYTIAPAGGGSNIVYPNALKTGENSAFTASISGTASVLVSAQGFTARI